MKGKAFEIIISVLCTISILLGASALVFWKDSAVQFTAMGGEMNLMRQSISSLGKENLAITGLQSSNSAQWKRIAQNHDDINRLNVRNNLPITGWNRSPE